MVKLKYMKMLKLQIMYLEFRIWNRETVNTPVIHLGAGATSNDMVLSTGGFTFNKSVDCNVGLSVGENLTLIYNKKIIWGVNSIVETSSPTVPITRFDAPNTGSAYWFFVGPAVNDAYRIFTISNTEVLSKRVFKCNNIDTENNTDLVFKRNTVEFMRFNVADSLSRVDIPVRLALSGGLNQSIIYEADEVVQNALRIWNKDTTLANSNVAIGVGAEPNVMFFRSDHAQCNHPLKVDTINTTGDVDLVFQRNGVEYIKFDGGSNIVSIPSGRALSTTDVYTNEYRPRSSNTDTIWYGLLSGGTGSVEIFRYDYSAQALDFNTVIDNTGRSVIGNIVDTTVSDKRLKTNIEEYYGNCSECIKTVKVKTFDYNDKKYDNNDKIGFIAQELLLALPEEFKDIVKDTKLKGEDETFKTINYMKLSVVLWKGLQEEILRREQIESKLIEMMNDIEELKKSKPKPKSKAKVTE